MSHPQPLGSGPLLRALLMATQLNATDLKKLSVPQLKLLCKEKTVTGYSKLNKDAIVAKLLDWQDKQRTPGAASNASTPLSSHRVQEAATQVHDAIRSSSRNPLDAQPRLSDASPHSSDLGAKAAATVGQAAPLKRPFCDAVAQNTQPDRPVKKRKITSIPPDSLVSQSIQSALPQRLPLQISPTVNATIQQGTVASQVLKPLSVAIGSLDKVPEPTRRVKGRFRPLLVTTETRLNAAPAPAMHPTSNPSDETYISGYSVFTLEQQVSLCVISLPPSVAQRKHIPGLSVILSGITLEDLRSCSLVSRTFRYAGGSFNHALRLPY